MNLLSVAASQYHWSGARTIGVILAVFGGVALMFICGMAWTYVYKNRQWPWESLLAARVSRRKVDLDNQARLKELEFGHQEEMARIENQKYLAQNQILGG